MFITLHALPRILHSEAKVATNQAKPAINLHMQSPHSRDACNQSESSKKVLANQTQMMRMADQNLSHEEVWDDSALIDSWNEAFEEYKVGPLPPPLPFLPLFTSQKKNRVITGNFFSYRNTTASHQGAKESRKRRKKSPSSNLDSNPKQPLISRLIMLSGERRIRRLPLLPQPTLSILLLLLRLRKPLMMQCLR